MRERLVNAAAEVLREKGYAGFRTAEVAKLAGVSRGAQLHHFPTKDSILVATAEHVFSKSLDSMLARAQDASAAAAPIDAIISDGVEFFFSEDFFVTMELALAGGKQEAFPEQIFKSAQDYRSQVEDEWLRLLIGAGLPERLARTVLWLTLSVVRGLAVRGLLGLEREFIWELLDEWKAIVREHIRLHTGRDVG